MRAIHARGSGEAARRAKRGRQPSVTRVAICVSRVLLDGLQKKEVSFLALRGSCRASCWELCETRHVLREFQGARFSESEMLGYITANDQTSARTINLEQRIISDTEDLVTTM